MTTGARLGIGTKLAYETVLGASPVAFTEIPQVGDFPEISETREFVETTNQDSLEKRREYIGGLVDVEEVEFEMNYLPQDAAQEALRAMLNETEPRWFRWRETQSSPNVVQYVQAFISKHSVTRPLGDKMMRKIVLRMTGPIYDDALPA